MGWNKVAIIGVGMIKFGELFEKSYEAMMEEAFLTALADVKKGISPKEIQAGWLGTVTSPITGNIAGGATFTGSVGLSGIPCSRVLNGCPTGADTLRNACFGVASGVYDVAIAVGVDKMRDLPTDESLLSIASEGHPVYERGVTAPAMFAPQAMRHMHQFGTTKEQMAMVAVKNHHNGCLDPYAHYQNEITVEDVLKSPVVCWPFNLYDCCPQTDGAAAVLICRADIANRYTDKPIYIAGIGMGTECEFEHEHENFVSFQATVRAGQQAYKLAGISPHDIDLVECHDCFTITEILNIEDLGFCEKGDGGKMVARGETALEGRLPVNTSGGLIAKGHPIGATGLSQICELVWQLRGEAGKRQVKLKKGYGLQHNVGGGGIGNSVVHILSIHKD